MKSLVVSIAIVALIPTPVWAETIFARVTRIADGDTIAVQAPGGKIRVRLACIDAPEGKQPGGSEATAKLRALLPLRTRVELRVVDTDRYGRTVAEVFVSDRNINLEMVKEGEAVIYRRYFEGCAASRQQYEDAEHNARTQKLGFWAIAPTCMPYDFRKKKC